LNGLLRKSTSVEGYPEADGRGRTSQPLVVGGKNGGKVCCLLFKKHRVESSTGRSGKSSSGEGETIEVALPPPN